MVDLILFPPAFSVFQKNILCGIKDRGAEQ